MVCANKAECDCEMCQMIRHLQVLLVCVNFCRELDVEDMVGRVVRPFGDGEYQIVEDE
jgi:hypothetical protein